MRRPKEPSSDASEPTEPRASRWAGEVDLPSFTVEEDTAPDAQSIAERHAGTGLVRHDVSLPDDRIDQDAARVVRARPIGLVVHNADVILSTSLGAPVQKPAGQ